MKLKGLLNRINKELPPHRGERIITHRDAVDACEYDGEAMRIIQSSDFTTHNRIGVHRHIRVANILNDFFEPEHFRGKTILELGPGHYSFAMLARHLGAARVVCVERYGPHVELGRHLGFDVLDKDFQDVTPDDLGGPVDGLWMKGAFNACLMAEDADVETLVRQFTSLIRPDGWGWCVTVNNASNKTTDPESFLAHRIDVQARAFERSGWRLTPIAEEDRKRYAVSYAGSRYYFTRGLGS